MNIKDEIKQVIREILQEAVVDPDGIMSFKQPSNRDEFYDNRASIEVGLDEFTKAYFEAALWSSNNPDSEEEESMDKEYEMTDIAQDALNLAKYECRQFQSKYKQLWQKKEGIQTGMDDSQAGHDFWLTRNGHGAGFWDRTDMLSKPYREALTKACEQYKEVNPIVGDDGLIYFE